MIDVRLALRGYHEAVDARLSSWEETGVADRLRDRDTSLWSDDPATPELSNRLGWLDLPEQGEDRLPSLEAVSRGLPPWMTDVVLLGMGGSSLAPEVIARTLGVEGLPLTVADSTHPRAVLDMGWIRPANTIFIVASKSGSTIETLSLFRHFWSRTAEITDRPGDHFIAITDPGSSLATLGRERGFLAVIESPEDVGGRFSALSPFGLVPAALMRIQLRPLLEMAEEIAAVCTEPATHNPGLRLGAALAELTRAGRDKVTFVTSDAYAGVPDWIEQLVAESTGKDGRGIIPIAHEPEFPVEAYGDDRVFVGLVGSPASTAEASQWGEEDHATPRLAALEEAGHPVIRVELDGPEDLFGLFYLWEVAVAMAGAALGVHPFDQPDVQLAKELAREAMQPGTAESEDAPDELESHIDLDLAWDVPEYGHVPGGGAPSVDVDALDATLDAFLDSLGEGDYIGIQAYLPGSDPEEMEALAELRAALAAETQLATTLGFGPRFLHSTGQLHKGGPASGAFVQLLDDAAAHVHIPETDTTFHRLITAQAQGDYEAMRQRGRRVLRIRIPPSAEGIRRVVQLIERRD